MCTTVKYSRYKSILNTVNFACQFDFSKHFEHVKSTNQSMIFRSIPDRGYVITIIGLKCIIAFAYTVKILTSHDFDLNIKIYDKCILLNIIDGYNKFKFKFPITNNNLDILKNSNEIEQTVKNYLK